MDMIKLHQFAEKLELLGYAKRCIADYPAYVRRFFLYLEEKEDVHTTSEIKPEHIAAYHTYLQYNRLKKGGYLSSATVRTRLNIVKTFYKVMHEERLIPDDYAAGIILPRRKSTLPRHVPSEKDLKTLIDSIQASDPITTRDRALLELLYATGMRSEETRSITLDHLDLIEKTLFVNGKGSKDRIVPVGEWVIPYLREYLEVARPKLIKSRQPTALLFLSKNGRMITNCNLGDLIKKYCKRAGLQCHITPHSIRHACATHLLRGGADIRYVQELLGHADLSTTQIYTKIDISFLKQAHSKYHPRERGNNENGAS
jgi:site-specific recombinase XerD